MQDDPLGGILFEGFDGSVRREAAGIRAYAEAGFTPSVTSGYLTFRTTTGTTLSQERMRISSIGNVGIGSNSPQARLHVVKSLTDLTPAIIEGCNEYADNAAALAAGLPIGALYRTGDVLKVVHQL